MQSLLSPISLAAAVTLALVFRWSTIDAQPTSAIPAPISASQRAAKELTDEAIAAERAKDYAKAIALYQQAYLIVPHPLLQFDIGQDYMLAGDLVQAERYFRLYLTLDPNGLGAPTAREFLASRPPAPEDDIQQVTDLDDPIASSRALEARYERARQIKRTGYKILGGRATLGAAAVGLFFYREYLGRGLGLAAFLTTTAGIGVCWYGNTQRRAARSVAWSPMLGSGFAGIA